MASSSLDADGQKRMRVMSLDYLKNSLLRKPSPKTVCCCNDNLGLNLDHEHTYTDLECEPETVEFKNGSCKNCGKAKLKSKSGLFKFLRKWLWGQNSLGTDSLNNGSETMPDCADCSLLLVPSDIDSKENYLSNESVNRPKRDSTSEGNLNKLSGDIDNTLTLDCDRGKSNCVESGICLVDNSSPHTDSSNCEVNSSVVNSDINILSTLDIVEETDTVSGAQHTEIEQLPNEITRSLTCELLKLSKFGWYWGPISREEAEEKLQDQSDGAFLVRDSSASNYLLSLSFRSSGKILHTRIEHSQGLFSFYNQPEQGGFATIEDLINHSVSLSQWAVFCYSRPRSPGHPAFPVRLTKPVSRFTQIKSLQYLCRFIIRQHVTIDNIESLPLPNILKKYIEESHY